MVGAIFEAVFHAGITFSKVVPFLMPKKSTAEGSIFLTSAKNLKGERHQCKKSNLSIKSTMFQTTKRNTRRTD